jgi:hypothetical protein
MGGKSRNWPGRREFGERLTISDGNHIFKTYGLLPRRLMARQQTLDLLIEVRILAGQHPAPFWRDRGISSGLIV